MELEKSFSVKDIVKDWLKSHGYGGLFNSDMECACLLDNLSPCESINEEYCIAGYEDPCDGTCEEGKCDFHIQSKKPVVLNELTE